MPAQAIFRARYTDEDALAEQLSKLFAAQRFQIKMHHPTLLNSPCQHFISLGCGSRTQVAAQSSQPSLDVRSQRQAGWLDTRWNSPVAVVNTNMESAGLENITVRAS
ncbi:hypothetical protein CIB48_g10193 [Xylaria polymorpha]|nr:hypothetical protein CIB48_g10193 [Xylaria polymorpha]